MTKTKIWINKNNGHHFSECGQNMTLNGFATDLRPDWADGAPDAVYGPLFEWNGGECPVAPDAQVRCLFRGRRPYIGPAIWPSLPDDAKEGMWQHAPAQGRPDPAMDIVAYQLRID